MSWKNIGSYKYYFYNYKHERKVQTLYFGRGPLAVAVSKLHAHARQRRLKIQRAIRKAAESIRQLVEEARSRITKLGELVDRCMRISGFHRYHGQWRRRGVINMRTLSGSPLPTELAIERERARRHFDALDGPGLEAELSRCGQEMRAVALDKLLDKLTSDAYQREAYIRKIKRFENKLAGDDPSHLVRMLARSVAILRVERGLADAKFFDLIGIGLGGRAAEFVLKWRAFTDRRLNAAVKILAYVRKVEASTIERTVERFRIAG
jgi:hypothetical protein